MGGVSRRRAVCSAGVSPAKGGARGLVAGMAGWRETKTSEPIDKATVRVVSERSGRNESERVTASKHPIRRPSLSPTGEGSRVRRNLADATGSSGGVVGDGTSARAHGATGEALPAPPRNRRSKVGRITGDTGKPTEGGGVADGLVVAGSGVMPVERRSPAVRQCFRLEGRQG